MSLSGRALAAHKLLCFWTEARVEISKYSHVPAYSMSPLWLNKPAVVQYEPESTIRYISKIIQLSLKADFFPQG